MTDYIPAKEVASYIRKALKQDFPQYKFSVRTDGCINISVKDLPQSLAHQISRDVREKYDWLSGEGFDGMIDMRYGYYHYQMPDGTLTYGGTTGTQGSGGVYEENHRPQPEGSKKVRLMCDFIFCSPDWQSCPRDEVAA